MGALEAGLIKVELEERTCEAALGELVDLMVARGAVRDRAGLLAELKEAAAGCPAKGPGGANITHVRSRHVDATLCAFGRVADPGPGSDARSLLFVAVSPAGGTVPLVRMLARISRLLRDPLRRAALLAAPTAQAALSSLGELA